MICLPRRFRAHEVLLMINDEDENGNLNIKKILLKYVKADPSYSITQSKKGIATDDKLIVYVELNDYLAIDSNTGEQVFFFCGDKSLTFELKAGRDCVKCFDEEYAITGINAYYTTSSKPIRLEITAQ